MAAALPDLPDDIWDAVAGRLPARDLLSLSRCGCGVRRACLSAVEAVMVVAARVPDGARVGVFLNPRPPPPRPGDNFNVDYLLYPTPATAAAVGVAPPASQAVATSLLFFMRTARVRRMGLCAGCDEEGRPVQGTAAPPFWGALLDGLAEQPLRELAVDGMAAGAAARATRLPSCLESLSVTGLTASQAVHVLPIIGCALSGEACCLLSLRIFLVPKLWLDPAAEKVLTSYVLFPLPKLRHLALCGPLERAAARAMAGLSQLTSLQLVCNDRGGAVAELALPALPLLQHLDLTDASVPDSHCEEALVRGRVLQTLAPSRAPADGARLVRMAGLMPALPVGVNICMPEEHCDVRPLCHHQGRASLRTLSFCLCQEVESTLAAAADGLHGLRELSLDLCEPSSQFCRWPANILLERLSLQASGQASKETLLSMVDALGKSPLMRRHLQGLHITAAAPLALTAIVALRSLDGLSRLDVVVRSAAGVAAEDRQQWEAAVRSTVRGAIHIQWLDF